LSESGQVKEIIFPDDPSGSEEVLVTLAESIILVETTISEYVGEKTQNNLHESVVRFRAAASRLGRS
jgi:hypothetical protein